MPFRQLHMSRFPYFTRLQRVISPKPKLLCLIFLAWMSGCGEQAAPPQGQEAPPYPTVAVARRSVETKVLYPASIEGMVNSAVRAKVSGYIQEVLVDEGEWVEQGQPLFKLETRSLSQEAEAARARIRAAEVEVDKLRPLVAQEIISQVPLQTAQANLEQARSSYQGILANINYAYIRSPVKGIVGTISFREGNLAGALDALPLTTISSIEQVYAYFSMNEKDFIAFIRDHTLEGSRGMTESLPPVQLQLADGSEYPHPGTIETISGSVDPNSGTVRFRATFPNPEGLLRNGSSGTIRLSRNLKDVLVVPALSTFEQQGDTFVYLVEQDTLRAKKITVTAEVNGLTVLQGLEEGDEILAKGVGAVRPGTRIAPRLTTIDSVLSSFDNVFK